MTGSEPSCSIVIRAFNEERHLAQLLEGIQRQTIQDVDVILVDSGSTDGTLKLARQFPVRVANIAPDEFTFGRSLNLGISCARSDLVVIASAHVYPVYPDWLERMLAPFVDPRVALVYGKQRGAATSLFSEQQVFKRWYPDVSNAHQDHPFCNNANAAVRRSLWQENPYDEYLSGLEDLAWAKWAIEQGRHLAYVADAEVIHIHQETPVGVYNRYRREAMAYKRIFPHEHFYFRDFFRLVMSNMVSDLWHAARQKSLSIHITSIFWFRWMQFWGTYQGYRQVGPLTLQLRQTFYYPQGLNNTGAAAGRNIKPIRYNEK